VSSYRILALDGGGIRGLYTAVLLDRLSKEVPGFADRADLLAGTSTGGILALGLAKGISTKGAGHRYLCLRFTRLLAESPHSPAKDRSIISI